VAQQSEKLGNDFSGLALRNAADQADDFIDLTESASNGAFSFEVRKVILAAGKLSRMTLTAAGEDHVANGFKPDEQDVCEFGHQIMNMVSLRILPPGPGLRGFCVTQENLLGGQPRHGISLPAIEKPAPQNVAAHETPPWAKPQFQHTDFTSDMLARKNIAIAIVLRTW